MVHPFSKHISQYQHSKKWIRICIPPRNSRFRPSWIRFSRLTLNRRLKKRHFLSNKNRSKSKLYKAAYLIQWRRHYFKIWTTPDRQLKLQHSKRPWTLWSEIKSLKWPWTVWRPKLLQFPPTCHHPSSPNSRTPCKTFSLLEVWKLEAWTKI